MIENGKVKLSMDRQIEGYPCRIPMVDIVTVGAGGGSIAFIDEGGAMKVGPQSAGAVPGPACYMRGGKSPTVTDGNIILGKLNQERILGGRMKIDYELARFSIDNYICKKSGLSVEDAAAGIISVANSNMIHAIRLITVEKGYDPRDFTLMAYGGAGPLHACEIALEMGISTVLIPASPGTMCSLGLLMADIRFDGIRSSIMLANNINSKKASKIFDELLEEGNSLLDKECIPSGNRNFVYIIDCRYDGQNYEIPIELEKSLDEQELSGLIDKFHTEHARQYGYANYDMEIQMVNYRLSSFGIITKPDLEYIEKGSNIRLPSPIEVRKVRFEGSNGYIPANIYLRKQIEPGCQIFGPAIVEQMDSTSVIPPQWVGHVDGFGNIILKLKG